MIDISVFTIRAYHCPEADPALAWVAHAWTTRLGFQNKKYVREMLPATAFGETRDDAIRALSAFLAEQVRREERREAQYTARAEAMRENNPRRKAE